MEEEGGGEAGYGDANGLGCWQREACGIAASDATLVVSMDWKEGRERRSQGWHGRSGKHFDRPGGTFIIKSLLAPNSSQ